MNNLVEIYHQEPMVGTLQIAQGFNRRHADLIKLIKRYEEDFVEFKSKGVLNPLPFRKVKVPNSDKPVTELLLNEEQALYLGTLFRNDKGKARDFKKKLVREFVRMKTWIQNSIQQSKSAEWLNVRNDGKIVYKQKTNIIEKFVNYAMAQGSTHARHYYENLAKMENSALFFLEQNVHNVREVLTIKQLMQVSVADGVIERVLEECMEQNISYKDCYTIAKERITALVAVIGKSKVIPYENDKLLEAHNE